MGNNHCLMTKRGFRGIPHGGTHSGQDLFIRLTPTRLERVSEIEPIPRVTQRAIKGEPQAFEMVRRLDQPSVDHHWQTERFGDRRSRLLRPLQRRAPEMHDVTISEMLCHPLGHLDAQL